MREIEDPPTWTFCFLALIAFSVEKKAKDLAAYTQLIIHLSQRHRGRGWLAYKLGHNQEERENKTCELHQDSSGSPLNALHSSSNNNITRPRLLQDYY